MYELMIIAKGGEGASNLAAKIEKHFKELEIKESKLEKMGTKTLAYPIAKQTEGEYLLYHFETEGHIINQLAGRLKLEDDLVLRYLITTYNPNKVTKPLSASQMPEIKTEESFEKPKPKVTVTTKIVASKKSQSVREPEESKSKGEVKVESKVRKVTKLKSTKVKSVKKGKKS